MGGVRPLGGGGGGEGEGVPLRGTGRGHLIQYCQSLPAVFSAVTTGDDKCVRLGV